MWAKVGWPDALKCRLVRLNALYAVVAALPFCFAQAQQVSVCCGHLYSFPDFPSRYVQSRSVWVWVPEQYNPKNKHAVIYMHDGQMLFDSTQTWNRREWRVDETASKLIAERQVPPFIVVGIANAAVKRYSEYFPTKALSYLPKAHRDTGMLRMVGKPLADDYLKFLVFELKPFIDSAFSVWPDARHTFLLGSSMGGLISLYGVLEYPNVFGGAACLSTHWIGGFVPDTLVISSLQHYVADHLPPPGRIRLYFDYGTETLDRFYEPYQIAIDRIGQQAGYTSAQWLTRRFPGDEHSEVSWSRRLSIPLQFLLKTP
ncbi:MAG: alpha/beta hydrolase-fold protein [Chitinophagales bacterium]|nr:alpha/beta hydrolase-fold protein [Chitinophagales bacterium]MDW8427593.1 alpha/beta hydrolase-fold protein [Chitinophagales bacterium]